MDDMDSEEICVEHTANDGQGNYQQDSSTDFQIGKFYCLFLCGYNYFWYTQT